MRDYLLLQIALLLGLAAYLFQLPTVVDANRKPAENQASFQMRDFVTAADGYIKANFAAVNSAAASGVVVINAATLVSNGRLSTAFLDRNTWGQSHMLLVRQIAANRLQAVAATCIGAGGRPIPDFTLSRLASLSATREVGKAGAVMAVSPTMITGAVRAAVAPFGNAQCPLVPGQLATVLDYDGTQDVASQYLWRAPPPGMDPTAAQEMARMHQDLQMGNNNILEVGDIFSPATGHWLSEYAVFAGTFGEGDTVAKPACPSGTPRIAVNPVMASDNGGGAPMIGYVAYASENANSWTIHIAEDTQNASGNSSQTISLNQNYGRTSVFTSCTRAAP